LYDAEGSRLFEKICDLEEYYPTRTELEIMDESVQEMAAALGTGCLLIELGSGDGRKTEVLLRSLVDPVAYVPIDISPDALKESTARLAQNFPSLRVEPICADYSEDVELPDFPSSARRVMYFPGSTIGNFDRQPAVDFMRRIAKWLGSEGGFLVGVDLRKAREVLEPAYDDAQGVTAAFNLNYLVRINRELGADFDLAQFRHIARWNEEDGRVEMHLESQSEQTVRIGAEEIFFHRGETICTEHSNKFGLDEFRGLAARAGFSVERVWTDSAELFSVQLLTVD
jgi:dimethylhistidine N-methyltransferase